MVFSSGHRSHALVADATTAEPARARPALVAAAIVLFADRAGSRSGEWSGPHAEAAARASVGGGRRSRVFSVTHPSRVVPGPPRWFLRAGQLVPQVEGSAKCEALRASRQTLLLHAMVDLQATCRALQACRQTYLLHALVEVGADCEALHASWQTQLLQAQVEATLGKSAGCPAAPQAESPEVAAALAGRSCRLALQRVSLRGTHEAHPCTR